MSNSQAVKAMVAIATCSAASGFVVPAHLGNSIAIPSAPTTPITPRTPASRGEAAAPLSGLLFPSILDIFDRVRETDTCIPQDKNANHAARERQLKASRKKYDWDTTGIPEGTPYLKGELPNEEKPQALWLAGVINAGLKILTGTIRGTVGAGEIAEALASPAGTKAFLQGINDLLKENVALERATDIDCYEDLHAFPIKDPDTIFDWTDDDTFARLRLQGANCVVIKKASAATRAKLTVLDTDPAYESLKTKVDSLLAAGKLFVVDHELLEGMNNSEVEGWTKYVTAGIALFEVVEDDLLPIKPIGIQLSQGKEATPIFLPEDGINWHIAKACFEAAEFIIHENVSHLGNTHLVMEGAMVAMHRQLPEDHPLYDLLHPHLEGTAFINSLAQDVLITQGGAIDDLTANQITESWELVTAQTMLRVKSDFSPMADFENREVTKKDFPGRYMYRDVGTQYWDATHTWVKEYLDIYYASDKDMVEDYELQGFIREMTDNAQMKWFEEFETTQDKKGLVAKIFASFIYTASTLHAAVNFPQTPSMSFVPSSSGSVYAQPPTDKSLRNKDDFMNYLAPMEIAIEHVAVLTLLGSVHHTRLGEYSHSNFEDDRVKKPLAKFQRAIEDIEEDLEDTNSYLAREWRKRGKDKRQAKNFAYKELLPRNIPQSINI
eukprot:jgi/Undpi1/7873/HiC_scaffold_24.g10345.m1